MKPKSYSFEQTSRNFVTCPTNSKPLNLITEISFTNQESIQRYLTYLITLVRVTNYIKSIKTPLHFANNQSVINDILSTTF